MRTHFGYLLAAVIFVLDRISKILVVDIYELSHHGPVDIFPFFNLTLVYNPGISLGLFQMEGDAARYALITLTGAVTIFVAVWLSRAKDEWVKAGLGLVLGGAIGNIWDRFEYGAVADFFHFFIGDWSFYIFNVADASISIGVAILLWDALLSRQKKNK